MSSVNVRDVAVAAGVSVGTVSNVLNRPERVSEDTTKRVLAAVEALGFVRNDAARQLRVGTSRMIGMIVHDVGNPFFTDIARGAERSASEQSLAVVLGNSDQNQTVEASYLDLFEEQRVRGVLIAPLTDLEERLLALRERGTPIVLVDRISETNDFSSVSVDDVSGGYQAVRHLLETGRRRIGFAGGPPALSQVVDRLAGARRAIDRTPDATLEVFETGALTVAGGRQAGSVIAARPAAERPDAVFAANDLVAVGVLQAFLLAGSVTVPRDVAIIGYDDIAFAEAAAVPLSSMRQPAEQIGRAAIELLQEESAAGEGYQHRRIVFTPKLVVRASTAPN